MSKLKSFAEFCRLFFAGIKEDWIMMDRKLLRIAAFVITFVLAGLFYLYFFQNTSPFGFGFG
ncbi:MAG: hypothetical protein ABIA21_03475 [Candidatus Aenigmatarchaeota archaeon]